ncbi:MAG: phosphatidylserine decarboxylase [Oscillospiraceae bacterium]|nr:phosphatidylserine decarboxylase [Oscillospiraceae bacterium]
MKIYDRAAEEYREEKEYGEKSLKFLYGTVFGRVLLKVFFCRGIYSKINGAFMRSPLSVRRIKPFIQKYGIYIRGCERTDFRSFDDFFTRKYPFTADCTPDELIAPCCGRLSVYPVSDELTLKIKGSLYTLPELVGERFDVSEFRGGICLVYRLAVEDCHRYVFCDDGEVVRSEEIKGVLHTVRPISEKYRVFSHNHRVCTLLRTERFGDIIQTEVGALQIGRITNHDITRFSRMEEKGFFGYGGSTIIQLFKRDIISVDGDIQGLSGSGIEVSVKTGDRIGERVREQ